MITFIWKKGTAADAMRKRLKDLNIPFYHNLFFTPCIYYKNQEIKVDYRHIDGDFFEIVEKICDYREEPVYRSIEI